MAEKLSHTFLMLRNISRREGRDVLGDVETYDGWAALSTATDGCSQAAIETSVDDYLTTYLIYLTTPYFFARASHSAWSISLADTSRGSRHLAASSNGPPLAFISFSAMYIAPMPMSSMW